MSYTNSAIAVDSFLFENVELLSEYRGSPDPVPAATGGRETVIPQYSSIPQIMSSRTE